MGRYSQLAPLTAFQQAKIGQMACDFFSVMLNHDHRKVLDLPINPTQAMPFNITQFFKWAEVAHGTDLRITKHRVIELLLKLEYAGILTRAGNEGNIPGEQSCYYFMRELSKREREGWLFLGSGLGPNFIGNFIKEILALIIGTTTKGDISVGTGTLILPGIVLTCAHVINDMKLNNTLSVGGISYKIKHSLADKLVDHQLFEIPFAV